MKEYGLKTLSEIIHECKDGKKPDVDDARLAICALDALSTFDGMSIMRMSDGAPRGIVEYDEHFRRWKEALAKSPNDWLGPNNNPDNPECQRRRRVSFKLFNKVLSETRQLMRIS